MKRGIALAVVVFCLATGGLGPQTARAGGVSYLTVYPHVTHSGDTVYVSGTNLLPAERISLLWACPGWYDPTGNVSKYGNWDLVGVASTDDQGNFVGFPIRPHLNGIRASGCQVWVKYLDIPDSKLPPCGQFCPDIAGLFAITHGTLPRCSIEICAKVVPHPQSIRAGVKEGISIKDGWGGATARVTLIFQHPAGTVKLKPRVLDWNGRAHISVLVDKKYAHAGKVTVNATFKLGQVTGKGKATFTVVS